MKQTQVNAQLLAEIAKAIDAPLTKSSAIEMGRDRYIAIEAGNIQWVMVENGGLFSFEGWHQSFSPRELEIRLRGLLAGLNYKTKTA